MRTICFFKDIKQVPEDDRPLVAGSSVRLEAQLQKFKSSGDDAVLYLPRGFLSGWRDPDLSTENTQIRFLPSERDWHEEELLQGRLRLTKSPEKPKGSPTPWFSNGGRSPVTGMATVFYKPFGLGDVAEVLNPEDALRIVACVNACGEASISNEELQSGILKEMIDLLAECRKEFNALPHSLAYDFTHVPKLAAILRRLGVEDKDV